MNQFTHRAATASTALTHTPPRTPPIRPHQHRRTLADLGGRKATSPHVTFYKDFGRPIAKVFLMAFFTYQVTYWAWVKMEKEEARGEKEREVLAVEGEVLRLRGGVSNSKDLGGDK